MVDILTNQELCMSNVLSFRKKIPVHNLQNEVERMEKFIKDGGYTKAGPSVSATYGLELQNNEQMIDVEVLIPLDKYFVPPEGCEYKAEFKLVNAVSIRHTGNPARLQETCDKLMAFIEEHKLSPITCGYNVTIQEPKLQAGVESMIVDVYIGISPNLL